jgi:hypothetical protein
MSVIVHRKRAPIDKIEITEDSIGALRLACEIACRGADYMKWTQNENWTEEQLRRVYQFATYTLRVTGENEETGWT